MERLYINLGGRPGIDCGGFCEFCFFKNVDIKGLKSLDIGCINCPPDEVGCNYCKNTITGVKNKFRPIFTVLKELQYKLLQNTHEAFNKNLKIVVHADADVFFYPDILGLVSVIKQRKLPLYLGYTSGKNIKSERFVHEIISRGVDELTFSAFSTDLETRKIWMRDRNPELSLKSLKLFCENMKVNASVVVIPGVNDGEIFYQTCSDLEEWGIKSFILRRFGNYQHQGLIFNNHKPVSDQITPQTNEEFQELVKMVTNEFSFKVTSFPFYDPEKDFPFAILKEKNRKYLEELPEIHRAATIVTGALASPYLEEFFKLVDKSGLVNVVSVEKEIADLITPEDLKTIDLAEVKGNVILPRGSLVHQKHAQEILNKDGIIRRIKRGPYNLTHPYHENIDFTYEELIRYELQSFKELIDKINLFK